MRALIFRVQRLSLVGLHTHGPVWGGLPGDFAMAPRRNFAQVFELFFFFFFFHFLFLGGPPQKRWRMCKRYFSGETSRALPRPTFGANGGSGIGVLVGGTCLVGLTGFRSHPSLPGKKPPKGGKEGKMGIPEIEGPNTVFGVFATGGGNFWSPQVAWSGVPRAINVGLCFRLLNELRGGD